MTGIYSQIDMLSSALKLGEVQHNVLSQNLANANTAGYKARNIDFEKMLTELAEQEGTTVPGLTQDIQIAEVKGLPERVDGNNVDLAVEISKIKKNSMLYQSFSHLLASKVAMMRKSISG